MVREQILQRGAGPVVLGGGAQTISATATSVFYNLTLAGTGAKRFTNAVTINDTLMMSGTATVTYTTTPTMASTSTLEYSEPAAFTAGAEWQATLAGNLLIANAGGITGPAATRTVTGSLIVNSGASLLVQRNLTVTGATSITGSVNFNNATVRAYTLTGDVTLYSGSSWVANAAAHTFSFGGNFSDSATTFTPSTGVHTFSGAGKTISGSTITPFPALAIAAGASYTMNNSNTAASLTLNGGATAATLTFGGAYTLTVSGAVTISGPTAGVTNLLAVGTGTLGAGSIAITAGGTAGYNASLTVSTGTVNCTGALTFSGTGTKTFSFSGAGTLNIGGNLGGGGTFTTVSGSIVNCNGSSAQTLGGTAAYTYSVLKSNNTAGVTLGYAATITTLTIGDVIANSVFNDGGYVITPGTGSVLNLTSGTYNLGSATVGTAWPAWGTVTIGTGTTVGYVSAVAQAVSITPSYQNLTFSGASTKTPGTGTLTVNGNLTLTAGTLALNTNNNAVNIAGNWTNNGGTLTAGTGIITFNGTNAQAINGTAATQTFGYLTVNMTAGQTLSVSGSTTTLTVNNNFTETQGNFTAPATMTVTGNVTLTAGTFTASTNLNVAGNWTNNGGTLSGGTTVTFTGATKTISGSSSTPFPALAIAAGASYTMNNSNTAASLTLNGGATGSHAHIRRCLYTHGIGRCDDQRPDSGCNKSLSCWNGNIGCRKYCHYCRQHCRI